MTKAELYQKACMLPLLPGVYIIRDKSDTIIYICLLYTSDAADD